MIGQAISRGLRREFVIRLAPCSDTVFIRPQIVSSPSSLVRCSTYPTERPRPSRLSSALLRVWLRPPNASATPKYPCPSLRKEHISTINGLKITLPLFATGKEACSCITTCLTSCKVSSSADSLRENCLWTPRRPCEPRYCARN